MKYLSRHFYVAMTLIAALLLVSCNQKSSFKLKKIIERNNRYLPVELPQGTFDSLVLDEETGNVVFTYTLNDEVANFDTLKKHEDLLGKKFVLSLGSNFEVKQLVKELYNAQANILVLYKTPQGEMPVNIKRQLLKQLIELSETESKTEALKLEVEIANLDLPKQIDEVTLFEDLSLTQTHLEFHYIIDDTEHSMAEWKSALSSWYFAQGFHDDPDYGMYLRDLLFGADRKIRYVLTGKTSGESFNVDLSPYDIVGR